MIDIVFRYVSKEELAPKFGLAEGNTVYIRMDLPEDVQNFLRFHEVYHIQDTKQDFWLWREIRANWRGFIMEPKGFFMCMFMSIFSKERLKYYYSRFKEKK